MRWLSARGKRLIPLFTFGIPVAGVGRADRALSTTRLVYPLLSSYHCRPRDNNENKKKLIEKPSTVRHDACSRLCVLQTRTSEPGTTAHRLTIHNYLLPWFFVYFLKFKAKKKSNKIRIICFLKILREKTKEDFDWWIPATSWTVSLRWPITSRRFFFSIGTLNKALEIIIEKEY